MNKTAVRVIAIIGLLFAFCFWIPGFYFLVIVAGMGGSIIGLPLMLIGSGIMLTVAIFNIVMRKKFKKQEEEPGRQGGYDDGYYDRGPPPRDNYDNRGRGPPPRGRGPPHGGRGPPPTPPCPRCGRPSEWLQEYRALYCNNCREYLP